MAQHVNISIEKIELDVENPRIARFMEMYGGSPSAEQISSALRLGVADDDTDNSTSFRSLKESIRTHKGIIHPIIVNSFGDRFIVVEGNTRLSIYIEFHKQKVDGDWSKIPCLVYENMDKKQIDGIRLQAHLVGVRPWDPYSKAKYLSRLRNEDHLTWSEIVDFCGGKEPEAEKYVAAYEDMETYYRPLVDDSEFDTSRFSGFVELQRRNIKEALVTHSFTETDFSQWIKDSKLFPLWTVRKLPPILGNKVSKEIFLKKDAREALKVLEAPSNEIDAEKLSIKDLANILTQKLRKLPREAIRLYQTNPDTEDYVALQDLYEEVDDTLDMISPK